MSESLVATQFVDMLIDEIEENGSSNIAKLPKHIIDKISINPKWTVAFLQHLERYGKGIDEQRTVILLKLIDEGLSQVRYSVDRKDEQGLLLRTKIEETINRIFHHLPQNLQMRLNQIIFDSKLAVDVQLEVAEDIKQSNDSQIDITPCLPELLERFRREKAFKNAFELYELILPHIQLMPMMIQLSIIAEMARTKKAIAHEVAVLMLLHPKPAIRKRVAELLYRLSDNRIFTPVDLRRLIMLRNWVPQDEHADIDRLITQLRKSKLSPAPYPMANITRLVGSSMDGAGAAFIMFEAKYNSQRQVAGFLVKIGVGIRDPWVMSKVPKQYLDDILNDHSRSSLPAKPVSTAYVNKIVQHFLSESLKSNEVPEPIFIQVAEIFGAGNWWPQPLSWSDEIARLTEKYTGRLVDANIKASLQRSADWHLNLDIASAWFETGDVAENAVLEATEKHQTTSSDSLEKITTEMLMAHCFSKWKTIFLVTCFWMRTKTVDSKWEDLFIILHCFDKKTPPSSIPLICNLSAQTIATVFRREMAAS